MARPRTTNSTKVPPPPEKRRALSIDKKSCWNFFDISFRFEVIQ